MTYGHWSSMWRKAPSRALWFWDIGQVYLGNGGYHLRGIIPIEQARRSDPA